MKRRKGRPLGSSFISQATLLLTLKEGSKSFQSLVEASELHRNTVGTNSNLLIQIGVVSRRRKGREVFYCALDGALCTFAYYCRVSGNLRINRLWRILEKRERKGDETFGTFKDAKKLKEKYEPELKALPSMSAWDSLRFAEEYRKTKREKFRVGRGPRPKPMPPLSVPSLRKKFTTSIERFRNDSKKLGQFNELEVFFTKLGLDTWGLILRSWCDANPKTMKIKGRKRNDSDRDWETNQNAIFSPTGYLEFKKRFNEMENLYAEGLRSYRIAALFK